MPLFAAILCLASFVGKCDSRHIHAVHANHTVEQTDSSCLQACLDECMEWRNSSFHNEDCISPCAVYVEESKRLMNEHSGIASGAVCNNTRAVAKTEQVKPEKVTLRTVQTTTANVTEIWWTSIASAVAYSIQVLCHEDGNDTVLFEDDTWLNWYAFHQCYDTCIGGGRARVAAWNSAGVGDYSEFSDHSVKRGNSTALVDYGFEESHRIAVGFAQ